MGPSPCARVFGSWKSCRRWPARNRAAAVVAAPAERGRRGQRARLRRPCQGSPRSGRPSSPPARERPPRERSPPQPRMDEKRLVRDQISEDAGVKPGAGGRPSQVVGSEACDGKKPIEPAFVRGQKRQGLDRHRSGLPGPVDNPAIVPRPIEQVLLSSMSRVSVISQPAPSTAVTSHAQDRAHR